MRFLRLALVLPLLAVACGDKSAVSLAVTCEEVTVEAMNGALGATLSGGFQLDFELGSLASGSTTVTLGSFALQSASGSPLVDPLPLTATGVTFPLLVSPGAMNHVTFTFSRTEVLSSSEYDAICAGQVMIVGSVMDTLKGGTDPVQSIPITPTCS